MSFFSNRFSPKYKISNFAMKLVQWEPSWSMRAGGRTDGGLEANNRYSQLYERAQTHRYENTISQGKILLHCLSAQEYVSTRISRHTNTQWAINLPSLPAACYTSVRWLAKFQLTNVTQRPTAQLTHCVSLRWLPVGRAVATTYT